MVEEGRNLAKVGDIKRAVAKFQQALKLNPHLTLNPETEAQRIRTHAIAETPKMEALALVQKGDALVRHGKITEALFAYSAAQQRAPTLKIPANSWNALCWNGTLLGYATKVMDACNFAVALASGNGGIRDSGGLARALTGDTQGAIEDFQTSRGDKLAVVSPTPVFCTHRTNRCL